MRPSWMSPFRWFAPAGARAKLSIFIFHRVLAVEDPLLPDEPAADRFERIVAFLARHFNVMPLHTAAERLAQGRLPAAAACITFDDGYADNLQVAAPILLRHGMPATFFIATGYIEGGRMWNDTVIEAVRAAPGGRLDWRELELPVYELNGDASRVAGYQDALKRMKHLEPARRAALTDEIGRRAGLPQQSALMMTRDQLRELRRLGMDIGAHTITHPILSGLDDAAAREEIGGGGEQLAHWLGERPTVFAYPNGVPVRDYGERDVRLVREAGFSAAVSTARGVNGADADVFQLRRFTPWDSQPLRFALRCLDNMTPRAQGPVLTTQRTS